METYTQSKELMCRFFIDDTKEDCYISFIQAIIF